MSDPGGLLPCPLCGSSNVSLQNGERHRSGVCGKTQEFAASGGGGGDNLARKAGWTVEWRPQPFVRCPNHLKTTGAG